MTTTLITRSVSTIFVAHEFFSYAAELYGGSDCDTKKKIELEKKKFDKKSQRNSICARYTETTLQ